MMNTISIGEYKTAFGDLVIGSTGNELCLCDWKYRTSRMAVDQRIKQYLDAEYKEKTSAVHTETIKQLGEYFSGERTVFDLPLKMAGTSFQMKVWNALRAIPYGKTVSYLDLSRSISGEKAVRAVAAANGANDIAIIIPCHRVIGQNGKLTGYAGGLPAKNKLLQLEQQLHGTIQMELFGDIIS
ncbi:MAG TPA: methylated-DNA--[protein]-cysteine S-methyltransferase [Bacteroidales bacterium]|nr:methylated-DNA--[protein]-cysteine S-methyltransferase [Bacteroidales bacterium]